MEIACHQCRYLIARKRYGEEFQLDIAELPVRNADSPQLKIGRSPYPQGLQGTASRQNMWLTVDPYMRARISQAKNYAAGFKQGHLMTGGGVGEVISSVTFEFKLGDIVNSDYFGWQPSCWFSVED